jgi:outer membrane protein TolC
LVVDSTEGLLQTTRGALAASMGLPANFPFDIEDLPGDVPVEALAQRVDDLIAEALANRPDLAAARAQSLASEAQVKRVRGQGLPTITGRANAGWTRFDVNDGTSNGSGSGGSGHGESTYGGGFFFNFPLFTGYSQTYSLRRATAQAESDRERARSVEQQVIFQVFSGYYALKTATQKVRTTDELLASADQSEQVALGRYKEGVGTILDLLTAQTALADARAQRVQSRWEWYTALAQLAHDTGLLGLQGETPFNPRVTTPPARGTQER